MTMKAKKRAVRRGRKRASAVRREPNGRPSRAVRKREEGPVILDASIEQRARAMGIAAYGPTMDQGVTLVIATTTLRKTMRDEYAGTALGRLLLAGQITQRQHDAGRKYGALYVRWARLAECPPRHAKVARLPVASDTPADAAPQVIDWLEHQRAEDADGRWARAKDRMARIEAELRRLPGYALTLAMLESVCVEDIEPREGPWRTKCLPTLTAALDVLASHYRLEPDDEAEAA